MLELVLLKLVYGTAIRVWMKGTFIPLNLLGYDTRTLVSTLRIVCIVSSCIKAPVYSHIYLLLINNK